MKMSKLLGQSSEPPVEVNQAVAGLLHAEPAVAPEHPEDDEGVLAFLFGRALDVVVLTLALLNLTAVFFDYSYVALRPMYQQYAPLIVAKYDPQKGIEPYRSVQDYMDSANAT